MAQNEKNLQHSFWEKKKVREKKHFFSHFFFSTQKKGEKSVLKVN